MAATKKATKKAEPYLEERDGQWYIIDGKKETDVGRSQIYAEQLLAEHKAK